MRRLSLTPPAIRAIACSLLLATNATVAQTTTSRVDAADIEPIALPKREAGKVTARVNEAPQSTAQERANIPGVVEERLRGRTLVRVTPEGGPTYYLSDSLYPPTTRRRDSESLSVPQWQIFKF